MKFKIQKKTCNPTNVFHVELNFMHGDGDAYTTEIFDAGIRATNAEDCINYFNKHLGKREYEGDVFLDWIPLDAHYGYDYNAYIDSVKLFWYNGEGSKFEVEYE